jgi:hypothetical protein
MDALRWIVIFDASLAFKGRAMARCSVILAERVAASRKSICRLLPANPMACAAFK